MVMVAGGATYVGRVVDLVEALEQSKDAALNLVLVQAGGGRVEADGDGLGGGAGEGGTGRDERATGEGSGLLDGGTDGARGGGRGTEDCCAEHGCGLWSRETDGPRKTKLCGSSNVGLGGCEMVRSGVAARLVCLMGGLGVVEEVIAMMINFSSPRGVPWLAPMAAT